MSVTVFAALVALAPPLAGSNHIQVVQQNGLWWFQDSNQSNFLSLGVCCVDPGVPFADYDPANPSYAAWRSYPDKKAWASDVAARLQAWHFNTVGAWSDLATANSGLYQTPILNIGAAAGAPWRDMWSSTVVDRMTQTAQEQIKRLKPLPGVIGYFSDNEMGWWEGALFDWIWKSDTPGGNRAHFVAVLHSRYKNWAAVTRDFIPVKATGFADLLKQGRLMLRPGGSGMKAVQDYMGVLADRYYHLCRYVIRKADPNALFLGDRYISNFYPEVAAASKPYVDLVSTNLNASWNDGTFAHFYLPSLEAATGKPLLISEYYQASTENRSGNKNDSSGFPVSATQEERASRVEVATRYLLSQPYVIGAHWFQYYDEPAHGRGDGENYDMGLVDTANKPYDELVGIFHGLDANAVHSNGSPVGMDASSGIPAAPTDPSKLESWNRTRGYIPPSVDSHRADLYACYSGDGLYLAIYWDEDRFAEAYYQGGQIPPQEFPQIHVRAGKAYVAISIPPKGAIQLGNGPKLVHELRGVRNELILKLSAASLGPEMLKTGDQIQLDVGLATRGRAYFGRWTGQYSLGG